MQFDADKKYRLGLLLSCIGGLLTVFSFNQPDEGETKSIMITMGAILAVAGLFLAVKAKGNENN